MMPAGRGRLTQPAPARRSRPSGLHVARCLHRGRGARPNANRFRAWSPTGQSGCAERKHVLSFLYNGLSVLWGGGKAVWGPRPLQELTGSLPGEGWPP